MRPPRDTRPVRALMALSIAAALLLGACDGGEPRGRNGESPRPGPTPTATISEGQVLLDLGFEGGAGPVATGETDTGGIAASEGALRITLSSRGQLSTGASLGTSADVLRVEADVTFVSGTEGEPLAAAVGCTAGEPDYQFFLFSDGEARIYLQTADDELERLTEGTAPAPGIGGSARLRAECTGQGPGLPVRLSLYVDDQLVAETEQAEGIGSFTQIHLAGDLDGSGPAEIAFDSIRATRF